MIGDYVIVSRGYPVKNLIESAKEFVHTPNIVIHENMLVVNHAVDFIDLQVSYQGCISTILCKPGTMKVITNLWSTGSVQKNCVHLIIWLLTFSYEKCTGLSVMMEDAAVVRQTMGDIS